MADTTQTKLAKNVHIDTRSGEVLVDGEPLGFHLAQEPITITVTKDGLSVAHLPLIFEGDLTVLGPFSDDQGAVRG